MVNMVKLYNTLTRQIDPIVPDAETGKVRLYCCGPTVYGPAHIGNFRTFIVQDALRRVLEMAFGAESIVHVRNITDVDDKTIRQSQAEGKTLTEFTKYWTKQYHADCEALNCLPPHHEPAATKHIGQQIKLIKALVDKEHAYVGGDGSVYFKVSSYADYGKLANLDTENLRTQDTTSSGEANSADEYDRESVRDFALWKAHKPEDGDNSWGSPWGKGRPGWHLECSAMSVEYLGNSFEIHGGGVDLTFPHHENEIAQSCCGYGGTFAKHWFHSAHLMVEGEKMSKSLGNLYTLTDLEAKGWTANEVRYTLLSGHYRQQLNFTENGLHAARGALKKLWDLYAAYDILDLSSEAPAPTGENPSAVFERTPYEQAWRSLTHDLSIPKCLGEIFSVLNKKAEYIHGSSDLQRDFTALRTLLEYALGLKIEKPAQPAVEAPAEIKAIAEERWVARQAKNWAESDRLRDELAEKGWKVLDGKDGYELEQST